MAKSASPGVGHNSGMLPSQQDVRTALAIEMIFEEEEKKLRERKKRARNKIQGMGIPISEISWLKSLQGKTTSEIEQEFRIRWALVGGIYEKMNEQFDLFSAKQGAPQARAAHYTQGLLQGLQGKEKLESPPAVVGDDLQQMIAGFNEGAARRAASQEILLEALDAPDGQVTDGTQAAVSKRAGKGTKKPDATAEQARADFSADQKAEGNADPLVVDGVKYDNMRQANAARTRKAAAAGAPAPEPVSEGAPPIEDPSDPTGRGTGEGVEGEQGQGETSKSQASSDASPEVAETVIDGPAPANVDYFLAGDPVYPSGRRATYRNGKAVDTVAAGAGLPIHAEHAPAVAEPKRVPMPDMSDWAEDDPEDWFSDQKEAFRRWFYSLEPDYVPPITQRAAVKYFRELRELQAREKPPAPTKAADDFEASPEELAKQIGRPAPELPDEADVDAEAQKLLAGGFVDSRTAAKAEAKKRKAALSVAK